MGVVQIAGSLRKLVVLAKRYKRRCRTGLVCSVVSGEGEGICSTVHAQSGPGHLSKPFWKRVVLRVQRNDPYDPMCIMVISLQTQETQEIHFKRLCQQASGRMHTCVPALVPLEVPRYPAATRLVAKGVQSWSSKLTTCEISK